MSDYGSTPPPPPPPAYGGAAGGPAGQAPPNYLVLAILSILCCLPFGIASIVFSTQVNSKWTMGDQAGALDASKKAKLFAIIGLVGGIVGTLIYVVLIVAGMAAFDPSTM